MGNEKKTPITQALVRQLFTYDGKKLIRLVAKGTAKAGGLAHEHGNGYKHFGINGRYIAEHRLVWLYVHGYMPELMDHIDGNRSNNCLGNLRAANKTQNNQNAKRRVDNKSGAKGVCWHKQHGKWYASVSVDGKQKFLGLFENLDDAKSEVINARNSFHQNFSNHGV